jgi:hypothetical protein
MVVWEDFRTSLETSDIYGARISSAGQNLDGTSGMKISAGDQDESRPRVAASGDGTNWVVAWRDLRNKTSYDLYGAYVSIGGKNHDPDGFALSSDDGDEDAPMLDDQAPGSLALVYQRLDPRTGYGAYRVRSRVIDGGAAVAAGCAKDDDCASRSCVDGFCCSTDCDGCGVCNVQPGTCTPLGAGATTPKCPLYLCKGDTSCPSSCANDADCASNAVCDPTSKTCVSRVVCIDDHTLKDLSGTQTDCTPFKCAGEACVAQCGSVDDCASGFVCDTAGRCVPPPGANDGGCAVSEKGGAGGGGEPAALFALAFAACALSRRRRR